MFDEKSIIQQCQDGDTKSFEMVVNHYKDFAFSIALKIVKKPPLAEEIVMDAFMNVYENLHSFEFRSSFKSWLYRIVFNKSISAKRMKRNRFFGDLEEDYKQSARSLDSADDVVLFDEKSHFIQAGLKCLKEPERLILSLFYLEECTILEICEILGLSNSNVKTQLHRSRKKLKTALENILKEESRSIL